MTGKNLQCVTEILTDHYQLRKQPKEKRKKKQDSPTTPSLIFYLRFRIKLQIVQIVIIVWSETSYKFECVTEDMHDILPLNYF